MTSYSATATRVILSMPGVPLSPRTATDLVIRRVEPSSGIGLGRPVQRMLLDTDQVPRIPEIPSPQD